MGNSKRDLKEEIKNGTSLLEIIDENIDVHARAFAMKHKRKVKLIEREIIGMVIDHLNDDLKRL